MLLGRGPECERLDQLIAAVRSGQRPSLVLRSEAGSGKTALLDYLLRHAPGCRAVRVAAVQSEMELAFAARRSRPAGELVSGGMPAICGRSSPAIPAPAPDTPR